MSLFRAGFLGVLALSFCGCDDFSGAYTACFDAGRCVGVGGGSGGTGGGGVGGGVDGGFATDGGQLFAPEAILNGGSSARGVTIANLNGDLFPDLVVTNFTNGLNVRLFLGAGGGLFQSPQIFTGGLNPYASAVGDWNQDGQTDLAVADYGTSNTISVLLNNGDGGFLSPRQFQVGALPFAIAAGLLNQDLLPDLAVVNHGSGTVTTLMGVADGGLFTAGGTWGVGQEPTGVAIGRWSNDAIMDLAVSNKSSAGMDVSILLGSVGGAFQQAVHYPTAASAPYAIATGDWNLDGKADLAVANNGADSVSILLGLGDGKFQPPINFPAGSDPVALATGDLNGDGKPDLAVANFTGPGLTILINTAPDAGPIDAGDPTLCYDNGLAAVRPIVKAVAGDFVVTEFMADPTAAMDAVGEWFEVLVKGSADFNGMLMTGSTSGLISASSSTCVRYDAGTLLLFANNADPLVNGNITPLAGSGTFQLINVGGRILLYTDAGTVDEVTWSSVPPGKSRQLDITKQDHVQNDVAANFCDGDAGIVLADGGTGDKGTPGTANHACP